MSLFICDECGCVENTNCCTKDLYAHEGYPNLTSMEMAGFRYKEDRKTPLPKVARQLLCSECNTGEWHGEFAKVKATEVEIEMGSQLDGEQHNVFTFHPLWHLYNKDPDNFNIEILKHASTDAKKTMDSTEYVIRNAINDSFENMFGGKCETYVRSEPKLGRNDPCKCGSGRKYKKCCLTRGE